jgi:hypothetical protein
MKLKLSRWHDEWMNTYGRRVSGKGLRIAIGMWKSRRAVPNTADGKVGGSSIFSTTAKPHSRQ